MERVSEDYGIILASLETLAAKSDGHFTIMKFTTNWKISLYTPHDRECISNMYSGRTLREAYLKMLKSIVMENM